MKRWLILGIGFLLLLIIIFTFKIAEKGNPVGEATSNQIGLNITLAGPPELTLISPKNNTYFNNLSLLLNFTSRYADSIRYNIDNSANTTITAATYFNTTPGSHTIYLYANNSHGLTVKNVSFFVNLSHFVIYYEEFRGAGNGNSNNFNVSSYEDIQNLSSIILENTNYGKILFNQAINVSNDLNNNDNSVNLSHGVEISNNRIEINTTALPNFNKPATLTLYNLTLANPRIAKDGIVCPETICTIQSYSGGTLAFSVTGFSVYSAEETPSTATTGAVTSSESGGPQPVENFTIEPKTISVSLKQGTTKEEIIKIKNTGTRKASISIKEENLGSKIKIEEPFVELEVGEEKTLKIEFIAEEDATPNLYIGKLLVSSGKVEEEILVSIEVESKQALFDVKIEIPTQYKYIFPGEELIAKIEMFNLGGTRKLDVEVEYIIKNKDGINISRETETIGVETTASVLKTFQIPPNVNLGDYILYARVTYNNQVASATEWFSIIKKPFFNKEDNKLIIYGTILLIIMVLIYALFEITKIKKANRQYISEITLLKRGMIKKK